MTSTLKKLKELDGFWSNDPQSPNLLERNALDEYIEKFLSTKKYNAKNINADIESIKIILKNIEHTKKESETCTKIIIPLLKLLGFSEDNFSLYDEQREFKQDGYTYIPDYTLFNDLSTYKDTNKLTGNSYFNSVELILEAKRTGLDLYKKNKKSALDDKKNDVLSEVTPLSQIRRYLRVTDSRLGILTNGNDWILVSKDSENLNTVYHIKLTDLIELSEIFPESILYWLIPFQRESLFNKNDISIFDVIEETKIKRNELELNLKQRVEPILLDILNEYISSNKKIENVLAKKEEIIKESIDFIYLLFYIACLEDKNLLPTANPIYSRFYSLRNLYRITVENNHNFNKKEKSFHLFNHLDKLASLVLNGCKGLESYNSKIAPPSYIEKVLILNKRFRFNDEFLSKIIVSLFKSPNGSEMANYRLLDTIQFGNIYEHILRLDIVINHKTKKFEFTESAKKNERTTAVYTPHHIVRDMVSSSLSKVNFSTWNDVENFKVIDPCFGSGHFLIEVARQLSAKILDELPEESIPVLKDHVKTQNKLILIQRYLFAKNLYGVDRGESCIEVAKFSIWLSSTLKGQSPLYLDNKLKIGNSLYGETELDQKNTNKAALNRLKDCSKKRNLISNELIKACPNTKKIQQLVKEVKKLTESLKRDKVLINNYLGTSYFSNKAQVISQQNPFFWIAEFPEVFLDNGKFSLLITNPPYDQIKGSPNTLKYNSNDHKNFRLSLMTDADIENYKILFEQDPYYSEFQSGYKNLFEGFILLRNKLLSEVGFYSLIVPNSILASEQTSKVRANLWKDSLIRIQEFPEKDAISKRVFRTKKVACAIITGSKIKDLVVDTEIKIYNDANDLSKYFEGVINFSTSEKINPESLPLVVTNEWQKLILQKLETFKSHKINYNLVKEGELNESTNEKLIKNKLEAGATVIFGTNRMQPFGFTIWPKQDIINYCELAKTNITDKKLNDQKKFRIAINGIAGTNDSRVLNALLLPPNTLINSNVNYINCSDLPDDYHPIMYLVLLNSFMMDQLIRIEKKTNHNSSSMIANLPILEIGNSDKKGSKISKVLEKELIEIGILRIKLVGLINNLVTDGLSEVYCNCDIDKEREFSISRELFSNSLDIISLIQEFKIPAKAGRGFKENLEKIQKLVQASNEYVQELDYSLNFKLMSVLGFSEEEIIKFLSTYKLGTEIKDRIKNVDFYNNFLSSFDAELSEDEFIQTIYKLSA